MKGSLHRPVDMDSRILHLFPHIHHKDFYFLPRPPLKPGKDGHTDPFQLRVRIFQCPHSYFPHQSPSQTHKTTRMHLPNSLYFLSFGQRFPGHLYTVSTTSVKPASSSFCLKVCATPIGRPAFAQPLSIRSAHFLSAELGGTELSSTLNG
jgi:hypothetical protein